MSKRLAVCVPYRNRKSHLEKFVPHLTNFLSKQGIDHKIFICHQKDNKIFNRGKTKNIAYKIAEEEGFDYFAFHDIDMLPEDNSCDYSYPGQHPVLLAVYLSDNNYQHIYPLYFGGCILFTKEQFRSINGYYNEYWGWGWEDEDLLYRCFCKNFTNTQYLPVNYINKNIIVLNGNNSYIKIQNEPGMKIDQLKGFTLFMLVKVQEKDDRKFLIGNNYKGFNVPVLSIGNSFEIVFDQFENYKIIASNKNGKKFFLSSKGFKNEWALLFVTVNTMNKEIRMFLNGIEAGRDENGRDCPLVYTGELGDYFEKPVFVGTKESAVSGRDINAFCKGEIGEIAFWNTVFTKEEILCQLEDVKNKINTDNLISHYNFEAVHDQFAMDKKNSINKAELHDCSNTVLSIKKILKRIEPFRRPGRFRCLPHKKEDFIKQLFGGLVKQNKYAAINEKIFRIDVKSGIIDPNQNGLNNLSYKLINKEKIFDNHIMINVES